MIEAIIIFSAISLFSVLFFFAVYQPLNFYFKLRYFLSIRGFHLSQRIFRGEVDQFINVEFNSGRGIKFLQSDLQITYQNRILIGSSGKIFTGRISRREYYKAINIASVELLERYFTIKNPISGQNVQSNGVAAHPLLRIAQQNSMLELIERDSVLFHYYTKTAPHTSLDFKTFEFEIEAPQLKVISGIMKNFDSAMIFRLFCPMKGYNIYWTRILHSGFFVSGWSIKPEGDKSGVMKSAIEALNGIRALGLIHIQKAISNKKLTSGLSQENFLATAREHGLIPAEMQFVLTLKAVASANRLTFLEKCNRSQTFQNFLWQKFDICHYEKPKVEFTILKSPPHLSLNIVRSNSNDVFQLQWPNDSAANIHKMSERKRIPFHRLTDNIYSPTVVY